MADSDSERARRYRNKKRGAPPRQPKPHGTYAAFRRHQRAGEAPCGECRRAEARRQRDMYAARMRRQREGCPVHDDASKDERHG